MLGAILDLCRRLSWCFNCCRIWHQSWIRNFGLVPHITPTKWLMKIFIAFSPIFCLWSCGRTSWYCIPLIFIALLKSSQYSLPKKCNFGSSPDFSTDPLKFVMFLPICHTSDYWMVLQWLHYRLFWRVPWCTGVLGMIWLETYPFGQCTFFAQCQWSNQTYWGRLRLFFFSILTGC